MACKTCGQVKNLATTMSDVLAYAAKHGKVIDKKLMEERLEICKTCELLDKNQMKCKACGCFLNLKTHLIAAKCPQLKWPGDKA